MARIVPFRRSGQLINDIDEFLDRCGEAVMVLEKTLQHYFEQGPDEQLEQRLEQIRSIEERADALKRGVANTMYSEMLLPDTRGDVLDLLDAVDGILDGAVHLLAKLFIERPMISDAFEQNDRALASEIVAAINAMLAAARIYFRDPQAVRAEVHKIAFHDKEATTVGLRLGRQVFDSDLPLDRKMHLMGFLSALRSLASDADDVGDRLAILAIKRPD